MLNIKNSKLSINLMMISVIASVLITTTIPALALDANNPAQYTVNYVIPSDTSFTVTVSGSQTSMNFNPTNGSSKLVEPTGQSIATNTPWANITNSGNANLNFSTNLTTANPSWVVLNIGSSSAMTDQIAVSNSVLSPAGWMNVAPGNKVQLYSVANFTNAPKGTTPVTLNIRSN